MPINELNPNNCCSICGAEFDSENNRFLVRCGNPIPIDEFSSKVCYFAKKRGKGNSCINPSLNTETPTWETFNTLDPKSEKVLNDIGVNQNSIDYLKLPGTYRYE